MKHLDLIGIELKSEFLCDLFETYDVQVEYEYDRTHENIPDVYHAKIADLGLEFTFDDRQILKTVFIKLDDATTSGPFNDDERIRRFDSKSEALGYANAKGLPFEQGAAEFLGEQRDWIRFEGDTYSVHYEFVESSLRKITLQAKSAPA